MVKYFARYDSVEAFEADKANLPSNCVILVGNEISIAPNNYTIATGNGRFTDEESPLPIPDNPDPGNQDPNPEPWAD